MLVKSKKLETQVDTGELDNIVTILKKTVNAMSRFNIQDAIDKSSKSNLKKNVLLKYVLEKATKQSMPKYSTTPFDQATLDEYDEKDKLLKLMQKSNSYDKHPHHKPLYDALVLSLIIDEDDMDKQLEDQSTLKK
ncbi:hypothetical protein Tco_0077529 [Tanacetum coccineum]